MSSNNASLTFLPWLRVGLNAMRSAGQVDNRRSVNLDVTVVDENGVNQHYYPKKLVLKGPGDIVGFSPRMVGRTEPKDGETEFEPNYLPFVEFVDPDFPWRYSIESGTNAVGSSDSDTKARIMPWLTLIVLRRDEFAEGQTNKAKLPTITVFKQTVLPDLHNAWAWAHVQVAGPIAADARNKSGYEGVIKAVNDQTPELTCSRLVCPRKLDELTNYSAFVVPVYKMGRDAALGREVLATGDMAWDITMDDKVELPVYYRWDFRTSEQGDFEELVDRLNLLELSEDASAREIDGSRPGYFYDHGKEAEFQQASLDGSQIPSVFGAEGALQVPGFQRKPLTSDAFTLRLRAEVNRLLKGPTAGDDEDPLVSLPLYGRHFPKTISLSRPSKKPMNWFSELNLDRRMRIGAAAATSIIKEHQEEFMGQCWEQVGEIREANDHLRLGAAAASVGDSIQQKHLDPLGELRCCLVTEPFHESSISSIRGATESMKLALEASNLPKGLISYSFKRLLAGRNGTRSLNNKKLFGDWLKGETVKGRDPDGDKEFLDQLFLMLEPGVEELAMFKKWAGPEIPPYEPEAIDILVTPWSPYFYPNGFSHRKDILDRLNGMIVIPDEGPLESLDPIMKSPVINQPMYRFLAEKTVSMLFPGLDIPEANFVMLLQENRKFMEAFMAGLNHEMGRELRWRGFPTDQRGTVFSFFWEPNRVEQPDPDIKPINKWSKPLGQNKDAVSRNNMVLVIKGDLIRRYPGAIIFMVQTEALWYEWNWDAIMKSLSSGQSEGQFTAFKPVFRGKLGDNMIFHGFPFDLEPGKIPDDYYFVIMESPSLPRFGLDVTPGDPFEGWAALSWENAVLDIRTTIDKDGNAYQVNYLSTAALKAVPIGVSNKRPDAQWGADAAALAYITLQTPVRLVISAADLLGGK